MFSVVFAGMGLTFVMLAAMLARHFNTTNVYTLFCFGHERRLALTALADGVVTIVAGLLFVAAFGTAGAPLGAIAGVAAVAIPLNLGALSAETGVSRRTLIASLSPWATRFAIVAVIAGLSTLLIRPSTVPALVTTVLAAAAVYALAVASPILRSPAGAYLQPIIVSIGRRVAPARLKPRTGDWLS